MVLDILSQDPLGAHRRTAFVGLTAQDAATLERLAPHLGPIWGRVLDRVLGHATLQPEFQTLFGPDFDAEMLRGELLAQLSDLTAGTYDESWVAERVRLSLQTSDAGVPPDWIASAWSIVLSEVLPAVQQAAAALDDAPETFTASVRALLKVAFLDVGVMLHTRAHLDREAMSGLRQFARTILESVPDGIVVTDPEGRIVRFNAAAERIFGVERLTVNGQPFAELLHEANRDEEKARRTALFSHTGAARLGTLGRSPTPLPLPMTGLHADGATVPLEVTFQTGTLDGEPICCAAVRDVSERVRVELALRRSETNFRALIEGSPDAVLVHRGGQVVYVNPGFLKLLGLDTLREAIGRPVTDFLSAADRRLARAPADDPATRAARLETASAPREVRFVRGETEIVTEAREYVLDFDAQPAIVMVARDMTERHRLAARMYEMDRAVAVGNLAAAAGHAINNPLTYILGNTHFARLELRRLAGQLREGLSESSPAELADRLDDVAHALDEAQEGAVRVRSTVASLRSVGRRDDPLGRRFRLDGVIDQAVSVAWNEIRHRARLERQYMAVPAVHGSEGRLTQVFVHLLLNAAHSIPEGASETNEIRIVMYSDAAGARVHVDVMDTGCGMSPEVAARAFEPFFSTRASGEGAGLGLTISRQIVEAAGGSLTLVSEPDMGTTVRIELPGAGEADRAARNSQSLVPDSPPGRILLIDDEPSIASAFRHVVDDRHAITTFTSARDALHRLRAGETWDVIFCDLHMPDMTGMQFHEALQVLDPRLAERTVFLTGGAFTGEARAFLRSVPNACLDKPFDATVNTRLLARLLRDPEATGA